MKKFDFQFWRCAVVACAMGWALAVPAQVPMTESQAKASAVFNFARYVEWPERAFASRDSVFVFCLAGRESLAGASASIENRALNGRTTQVRRVYGTEELRGCHVLFVGEAEDRRLAPMLRAVANDSVLTVGDQAGFTDIGGAIGIVLEDGRIRFDINRGAVDQAQLKASSNLLRLARNTR